MADYKVALIKIKMGTGIYGNAVTHLGESEFRYYIDDTNFQGVDMCLSLYCDGKTIGNLHWCKCDFLAD